MRNGQKGKSQIETIHHVFRFIRRLLFHSLIKYIKKINDTKLHVPLFYQYLFFLIVFFPPEYLTKVKVAVLYISGAFC